MAQIGWVSTGEPPCFLFTTQEIPGPYPDYPRGWGGANASGYSNSEFDVTCQRALSTLPDSPDYQVAHSQAQMIFLDDLPAIPLYLRLKVLATRADMCSTSLDTLQGTNLWSIETFDYGEGCR